MPQTDFILPETPLLLAHSPFIDEAIALVNIAWSYLSNLTYGQSTSEISNWSNLVFGPNCNANISLHDDTKSSLSVKWNKPTFMLTRQRWRCCSSSGLGCRNRCCTTFRRRHSRRHRWRQDTTCHCSVTWCNIRTPTDNHAYNRQCIRIEFMPMTTFGNLCKWRELKRITWWV